MLINTDVNLPFSAIRLLQQGWHLLMPSACLWCSLPVQSATSQLCSACQHALPQLPYRLCHYNLLWLPQVANGLKKPGFDQLLSVSLYQHPYQHWLQQWKFFTDEAAGELLQQQFCAVLAEYHNAGQRLPDAIVYVPMHPARQRKRGYNQAQLLAQAAACQLKLPLLHSLQKTRHQPPQVGLSRKQRQRNLRHMQRYTVDKRWLFEDHLDALLQGYAMTASKSAVENLHRQVLAGNAPARVQ